MSKRHLLVSAVVALVCGAILVLFTDIETSVSQLIRCGRLPAHHGVHGHGNACR